MAHTVSSLTPFGIVACITIVGVVATVYGISVLWRHYMRNGR